MSTREQRLALGRKNRPYEYLTDLELEDALLSAGLRHNDAREAGGDGEVEPNPKLDRLDDEIDALEQERDEREMEGS